MGCEEEFWEGLRGDSAVSSCPGWNAGAWPHIPHGGSTGDTQRSQCSGQTDKSSESWKRPFFHTKDNSLQWALTRFFFTLHDVTTACKRSYSFTMLVLHLR